MRRIKTPIFIFSLLFLLLIQACSGNIESEQSRSLVVGWNNLQGNYTILIADKMGYFEDHGINVTLVKYETSLEEIPDLAAAKIDGGVLNIGDILLGSNVADIKAVMVSDDGGPYSVVASSEITEIFGLEGKRIGVNLHTSNEMFVTYMLNQAGLNPREVNLIDLSPEEIPDAIPDQIDAGFVIEPYTSRARSKGNNILYSGIRYASLIPNLIVFRTSVIEQRPEDIRAFIMAWDEAVSYRLQNPDEANKIISDLTGLKKTEIGLTDNYKFYTIDDNLRLFSENPGTDAGSIYYVANFNLSYFIRLGDITTPPDLNKLLDPKYLESAH